MASTYGLIRYFKKKKLKEELLKNQTKLALSSLLSYKLVNWINFENNKNIKDVRI
jgi:hypothetical protein